MIEPLLILKHEHRVIERALHALDGVCLRLSWGSKIPDHALLQLMDFTSSYIDVFHHSKEEAYLFEALERQGITRDGGPLGAMEREHEIERELTDELYIAAAGYSAGDTAAVERFVRAGRRYIDHIIGHMEREDSLLFRLADELLDEIDVAFIKEGFHKAQAELGLGGREKYENLATELERAWSV